MNTPLIRRSSSVTFLVRPTSSSTGSGFDLDVYSRNGVVAVAVAVPVSLVGLGASGHISGPGAYGDLAGLVQVGEKLPPLPTVAGAVAHEPGCQPRTVVDVDVH